MSESRWLCHMIWLISIFAELTYRPTNIIQTSSRHYKHISNVSTVQIAEMQNCLIARRYFFRIFPLIRIRFTIPDIELWDYDRHYTLRLHVVRILIDMMQVQMVLLRELWINWKLCRCCSHAISTQTPDKSDFNCRCWNFFLVNQL